MNRYIDAEALKQDLIHNRSFYPAIVKSAIENAPTADVVEVRHGKNITKNHPVDEFICSECGLIMQDCCRYEIDEDADPPDENCYEFEFRYCPRCGVKIKF